MKNNLETSEKVYLSLIEVLEWIDPLDDVPAATRLLKALQAGHLSANGRRVAYGIHHKDKPQLGPREAMTAFLWVDLDIGPRDSDDYEYCALELTEEGKRPAWLDVKTLRKQVLAFWTPRASPPEDPEVETYHTGMVGAPTSKRLYVKKLGERIAAGEIEPTLEKEANSLKEWMTVAHPSAPTSGIKAIKNNIRKMYKEGRGPKKA